MAFRANRCGNCQLNDMKDLKESSVSQNKRSNKMFSQISNSSFMGTNNDVLIVKFIE